MNVSLEDQRGKMVDTAEHTMPKSDADRASILATRYSASSLVTLYSRVHSAVRQKSVDGTLGSQPNDDYVGNASGAGLDSFLGTF